MNGQPDKRGRVVSDSETLILAIDPGPESSGYYLGNPCNEVQPVLQTGHEPNHELRDMIRLGVIPLKHRAGAGLPCAVVIEDFEPWATRTGHAVVETCRWIGRFFEVCLAATGQPPRLYKRRAVCRFLVGDGQAPKAAIKAFCVDRYGPGERTAIGNRKIGTGPLYGLRVHQYDALALAIAYSEGLEQETTI